MIKELEITDTIQDIVDEFIRGDDITMSFYTHYPNRKDWRKPYRDSRRFDAHCRSHGACSWCRSNRLHNTRKRLLFAYEQIREWMAQR